MRRVREAPFLGVAPGEAKPLQMKCLLSTGLSPSSDQGGGPTNGFVSPTSQSCEYFRMTTRLRAKFLRNESFCGLT